MAQPPVVCETDRLILRTTSMEDADFLTALLADPEVNRFVGGVRTREWVHERLRELDRHYREHGFGRWVVELRSTREPIGRCGPMVKQIDGVPEVELGYAFAREHWGLGYATEAAAAALEHCFRGLGLSRVVAIIDPENGASIRVATKIGMRLERKIRWEDSPAKLYAAHSARKTRAETVR